MGVHPVIFVCLLNSRLKFLLLGADQGFLMWADTAPTLFFFSFFFLENLHSPPFHYSHCQRLPYIKYNHSHLRSFHNVKSLGQSLYRRSRKKPQRPSQQQRGSLDHIRP